MAQTAPHPRMHGLTHVAGGSDPVPGLLPPMGDTLDEKLAVLAAAWWKLDELTGTVAHDSSGNSHDLTATSPYTPPTWDQPTGPPGTVSALWVDATTRVSSSAAAPLTSFTDNFTAGLWVNVTAPLVGGVEVMGQGTPTHSSTGWGILVLPRDDPLYKFSLISGGDIVYADNPLTVGQWYFVAVVRDAGTWKLYVDGLLQADTSTVAPGVSDGANTWLGNDGYTGHTSWLRTAWLSYAFIVDRPMSGAELLDLVNADGADLVTDHTGWVLSTDENGNPAWTEPGVSVEHGGGTPDATPLPATPATPGSPASTSGWHLSAHTETAVLYDAAPGRFDVPSMKWVRVPFHQVRIQRTWETNHTTGATQTAWLDDDRGLSGQAKNGILSIVTGMAGTPDPVHGSHSVFGWFSIEWPVLDPDKLPNQPSTGLDAYVRAGRYMNLSTGTVLRAGPGAPDPTLRRFFEWQMPDPAAAITDWVDYSSDNPYPIYPVWAPRPLVLPAPYPQLSDALSGEFYAPQKTFGMNANLTVGANICMQVWQDSPWLIRFSTDTYRIPYPGLQPHYRLRPHLAVSYLYDPETIDHTTGKHL